MKGPPATTPTLWQQIRDYVMSVPDSVQRDNNGFEQVDCVQAFGFHFQAVEWCEAGDGCNLVIGQWLLPVESLDHARELCAALRLITKDREP